MDSISSDRPVGAPPSTGRWSAGPAFRRSRGNAPWRRELFIGEATVKSHLLRVFAELGVDDRTRVVMVAVERGLLTRPGG